MDRNQRGVAKIYQTLARIEDENRNFEHKVRKLEFFKDLRLVRKFLRYLLFHLSLSIHELFPYMHSFHIRTLSTSANSHNSDLLLESARSFLSEKMQSAVTRID